MYQKIFVPLDLSEESESIFPSAQELLSPDGVGVLGESELYNTLEIGRCEIVTLKPTKKAKDAPVEPDAAPGDAPNWFYYPPRAGVTYYSFEARPPKPKSKK